MTVTRRLYKETLVTFSGGTRVEYLIYSEKEAARASLGNINNKRRFYAKFPPRSLTVEDLGEAIPKGNNIYVNNGVEYERLSDGSCDYEGAPLFGIVK